MIFVPFVVPVQLFVAQFFATLWINRFHRIMLKRLAFRAGSVVVVAEILQQIAVLIPRLDIETVRIRIDTEAARLDVQRTRIWPVSHMFSFETGFAPSKYGSVIFCSTNGMVMHPS